MMKFRYQCMAACMGLLALAACRPMERTVATDPPGTDAASQAALSQQNVDAVIWQNSSAEAYRLYQQGYELARIKLERNLARPHALPPAVIVDIDETVLDNSPSNAEDAAQGRTFNNKDWKAWTSLAKAKALPGAVEFLDHAVAQGCAVYYITNREADEWGPTMRNLATEGFPMADSAHVLPMQGSSDKSSRRQAVATDHYVALLVGDQLTDFDQAFHDRGADFGKGKVDALQDTLEHWFVLLPNALYGTWLNTVSGRTDTLKLDRKQRFLQEHGY
jgi:5'-nucleotidase (lipoprotein e(P4) family)